jgi:YfiH family protein
MSGGAAGGLAARFATEGLDWIVPDWAAPPTVQAFFTTRRGGVSTGAAASLDLGSSHPRRDSSDPEAIAENRRRVAQFLPAPPVYVEQVHGVAVAVIDAGNARSARAEPPVADAIVTRLPDAPLAIRVADCLPVLLADRDGTVVAAAHAGWRGLAAGVLEATIAAMAVAPSRIVAWIGPAIGPAAFEVGPEVRAAFEAADRGAAAHFAAHRGDRLLADLPALARRRLAVVGVGDVAGGRWCTVAAQERFHSWRRDRSPGRMAALIWRDAPPGG